MRAFVQNGLVVGGYILVAFFCFGMLHVVHELVRAVSYCAGCEESLSFLSKAFGDGSQLPWLVPVLLTGFFGLDAALRRSCSGPRPGRGGLGISRLFIYSGLTVMGALAHFWQKDGHLLEPRIALDPHLVSSAVLLAGLAASTLLAGANALCQRPSLIPPVIVPLGGIACLQLYASGLLQHELKGFSSALPITFPTQGQTTTVLAVVLGGFVAAAWAEKHFLGTLSHSAGVLLGGLWSVCAIGALGIIHPFSFLCVVIPPDPAVATASRLLLLFFSVAVVLRLVWHWGFRARARKQGA